LKEENAVEIVILIARIIMLILSGMSSEGKYRCNRNIVMSIITIFSATIG